jgi:hypothetical protein
LDKIRRTCPLDFIHQVGSSEAGVGDSESKTAFQLAKGAWPMLALYW